LQDIVKLDKLMQPCSQVISAIQGRTTTLADCTRVFMYMTRNIMSVGPDMPRVIKAINILQRFCATPA
jgi:hypothetical protein